MAQYMLLIYHPNPAQDDAAASSRGWRGTISDEEMAAQHQRWTSYTQELKDAGRLVATHGLQGPEAATTVRVRDGQTQITDGPFAETKELLGGYYIIKADDLDMALDYASRVPNVEYGSVEVRPLWG